MTINERLKEMLKSKKQTQLELSEAIQVPKSTVNTWVKLGRDIPAQSIISICGFLECSVEYLLTGQETEKAPTLELSEDERDMLELFQKIPYKDQQRLIGRLQQVVSPLSAFDLSGGASEEKAAPVTSGDASSSAKAV